jgi:hypothetical protein
VREQPPTRTQRTIGFDQSIELLLSHSSSIEGEDSEFESSLFCFQTCRLPAFVPITLSSPQHFIIISAVGKLSQQVSVETTRARWPKTKGGDKRPIATNFG